MRAPKSPSVNIVEKDVSGRAGFDSRSNKRSNLENNEFTYKEPCEEYAGILWGDERYYFSNIVECTFDSLG